MRVLVIHAAPSAAAVGVVSALLRRGHEARVGEVTDPGPFDLLVLVEDERSPTDLSVRCRQVRAQHGDALLVGLLAAPWDDRVEAALDAGLDDYTPLPFEARHFEARLRIAERTLARRVKHRETLAFQRRLMLADRLMSVGTLAASASHEINNPLTCVIANVEFAERLIHAMPSGDINALAELRARLRRLLHDVREDAERIRLAVKHLRAFTRNDDDHRHPVVVEDVIESSIDMVWNDLRHRARLVREFGPVPAVMANQARLAQVFLNLLKNAVQAIPEGHVTAHRIRVALREQGDHVLVEISDTGVGIPSDLLEHIFDPFFTTRPAGEGVGLGLSICKGIVDGLGGRIEVESSPGHGSTFRVLLPASPCTPVDDPSRPPNPLLQPRRARILLVDDEASLRSLLSQILGGEHEVRAVGSGAEVLELLRRGDRYDVILCDLMMPEMSGIDLFEAIEALDVAQARRVIFLTGGAFTPRAQDFMARVDNLRLEKPFDIDVLQHMIRQVLP